MTHHSKCFYCGEEFTRATAHRKHYTTCEARRREQPIGQWYCSWCVTHHSGVFDLDDPEWLRHIDVCEKRPKFMAEPKIKGAQVDIRVIWWAPKGSPIAETRGATFTRDGAWWYLGERKPTTLPMRWSDIFTFAPMSLELVPESVVDSEHPIEGE